MKPLNRHRLRESVRRHTDAEVALRGWWVAVQGVEWHDFTDVRGTFNTASYVDPFVVFNIKGNDYRLVTFVDYERDLVVMKWFGTHADYDKEQWK